MRDLIDSTLGHYRIVDKIGEGGMGEVYRANDERLGRDVAIKVLPEHLADDPERRERFERESKAVAKLSHPHICTLHDVGREGGVEFLVMEHLDGESLADRLARGAVPMEEALGFAIQIAGALNAAHRQGILHRDLKPGNIMLTKDGAKLLDFGLAKLTAPDSDVAESLLDTEDKQLTTEGTLLGTVQYMAPEQLEGKQADARTDIFAFGAVLYETITGKRVFEGTSRASLISAIMSSEAQPLSDIQKGSPPALDRTVAKCLAKDPEERWQTTRDLVDELQWIDSGPAAETTVVARPQPRRVVYGAFIGALVATAIMWAIRPDTRSTPPPARLHLSLPDEQEIEPTWSPPFVFSPDGSQLVVRSRRPGESRRLHLRPIDGFEARPMAGTEGAEMPFFSPDGGWIGYRSHGKLRKLSLAGGAPVTIGDATVMVVGASWGPDDTIVFATAGSGLMKISAHGGSPEPLTTLQQGEQQHWWPQFLPDGKAIVFTADTKSGFRPAIASLETGEHRVLEELGAGRVARYVSSGHIVYAEGGQLLAVPFDPVRLQLTGTASSVLDGLHTSPTSGLAYFAVSNTGTLAYLSGRQAELERQFVLVDRLGAGTPIVDERGNFLSPSYSPDGTKLAVVRFLKSGRSDIWVYDLMSGARIRLTTEGENRWPIWGPGGDRITFSKDYGTIQSKVVGGEEVKELYKSPNPTFPGSWTPDGEALVFFEFPPETRGDIWTLSEEGEANPLLVTEFSEGLPELSPDGRWLAYMSNESGRYEVYVQAYPEGSEKMTISTDGGYEPLWSADGRELFYRIRERLMVVSVQTTPALRSSRPRQLFEDPYISGLHINALARTYDVAPDGQHFLMMEGGEEEGGNQLHLVLNWFEELIRLVPTE
jgi:serine/threonine-protein kinase